MRTLVVTNEKGGIGKTTIALHLAYRLQANNQRVLLIDMDPQGNTTSRFHVAPGDYLTSGALLQQEELPPIVELSSKLSLIPASDNLRDVESLPMDHVHFPKEHLAQISGQFDYCLIDTAPAVGRLLLSALHAASHYLIPCRPDDFSVQGIVKVIQAVQAFQQAGFALELKQVGILMNRVNTQGKSAGSIIASIRESLGDAVLAAVVKERVAITEAINNSIPVWDMKGKSAKAAAKAAEEMIAMCDEVIARMEA